MVQFHADLGYDAPERERESLDYARNEAGPNPSESDMKWSSASRKVFPSYLSKYGRDVHAARDRK